MTYREAIAFLDTQRFYEGAPTLDRIRALLSLLGDPQKKLRFIHVAGTNGKGSVCAMLDAVLRAAGYRVGRFTSPSLLHCNERITVNGASIPDEALTQHTARIASLCEGMPTCPNTFELLTALAFSYFAEEDVDLVVLEVGLGGRFDATNAIDSSLLSILTEIDFDHTHLLGNTIQGIAAEKAGIIKEGGTVLYGGGDNSALRTVTSIADLKKARLHSVDRSRITIHGMTLEGTRLDFAPWENLSLPLLGLYQPQNLATALTAVELLVEGGLSISDAAVREGIASVRWPARFELLQSADPILLFDGAHNAQGVRLAVKSILSYFPETKIDLLLGVMADKDYDVMIEVIKPIAHRVFAVTANSSARALPAERLALDLSAHKLDAVICESVKDGLHRALSDAREGGRPLLALGSLYLYAPLLEALQSLEQA